MKERLIGSFEDFGLKSQIVLGLRDLGYKEPLPIQIECIPLLLQGNDVLGMAQTGSGKTAAFILPLLNNVDVNSYHTQLLIVAPTRELALQISSVCSVFSKYIKKINIVTLYGGQSYNLQLKSLKKGSHIIVGTPGRLLDHLNRGNVDLSKLISLVVDEADEMLRMGFIEDIERIFDFISHKHQKAFFSATLPKRIRRISYRFMNNPKEICINDSNSNFFGRNVCSDIKQTYCLISGISKNEALIRFLEIENFDAVIVFVRTKHATLKISKELENFGYSSAPLNGDMDQKIRYRTLEDFRNGKLDVLIATDIASRGLDINRVSLVINYDIPINSDSYLHRIGRTGRAGRIGKSLLLVENREYYFLKNIERKIKLKISKVSIPTYKKLISCRLINLSKKIENKLNDNDIDVYRSLLSKIKPNKDLTIEDLAAILLKIAQENHPLVLPLNSLFKKNLENKSIRKKDLNNKICNFYEKNKNYNRCNLSKNRGKMDVYRISVGRKDGVVVKNIINIFLKKLRIQYHYIGYIKLFSSYSTIEISKDIPSSKILVCFSHEYMFNKPINIKCLEHSNIY